jgi:hypothetical protein
MDSETSDMLMRTAEFVRQQAPPVIGELLELRALIRKIMRCGVEYSPSNHYRTNYLREKVAAELTGFDTLQGITLTRDEEDLLRTVLGLGDEADRG